PDDVRHQRVAALGPLVRLGVGTHGHVLAGPLRRAELGGEDLPGVDLDHDLAVEVVPGVEVEVGVRVPGEAVVVSTSTYTESLPPGRDSHSAHARRGSASAPCTLVRAVGPQLGGDQMSSPGPQRRRPTGATGSRCADCGTVLASNNTARL